MGVGEDKRKSEADKGCKQTEAFLDKVRLFNPAAAPNAAAQISSFETINTISCLFQRVGTVGSSPRSRGGAEGSGLESEAETGP